MKKIYEQPEVLIVKTNVESCILAGSPGVSSDPSDPSTPGLSRDTEDLWSDED